MRDLLIAALVLLGSLVALRRPWIGVLVWTWLSVMNPHKYAWGFAVDAPLAALAAACTLTGLMFSKDRGTPLPDSPMKWFLALTAWVTLSWLMSYSPSDQVDPWSRVMKTNLMIFVTAVLLRTQFQLNMFIAVAVFSLAILGAKGGVFVFLTGGSYRVWGPPTSYINGNNEFAVALIAIIPLMRYLQLQMAGGLQRHIMTVLMVLCGAAALGSQSRGALIGGAVMVVMLWWRGSRNRLVGAVFILGAALALAAFMPDTWTERMNTIQNYQEDRSAMGRIAAWSMAFHAANDNLFGLGMNAARNEWFSAYSPFGLEYGTPVAHSIYFQVLGQHGWIGLGLYLMIWVSTWRLCNRLRKLALLNERARWCGELGGMVQVSLLGFLAGGAFLNLAAYDMSFNTMLMACLAMAWVKRRAWEYEDTPAPLGLGMWRRKRLATRVGANRP